MVLFIKPMFPNVWNANVVPSSLCAPVSFSEVQSSGETVAYLSDLVPKPSQAPPSVKPVPLPSDSADITYVRPSSLKQPPALLPKPYSRIPNHLTGDAYTAPRVPQTPAQRTKLCLFLSPEMLARLSPPLPPKKVMICEPAPSYPLKCLPSQGSHTHTHPQHYATLPLSLHPPSRIIEELNKTLAFTMQRFERWGHTHHSHTHTPAALRHTAAVTAPAQPHHRGAQQNTRVHHAEIREVRTHTH